MEEPNGHGAEHVTGGVPSPADDDDRGVIAVRSLGAGAGEDRAGGRAGQALERVPDARPADVV
jgi:hypothetical protein